MRGDKNESERDIGENWEEEKFGMYKLEDGRSLMSSYEDISKFFEENNIVGKTIADMIPFCHDYMIQNIEEVENFMDKRTQSAISTDGRVCLLFTDNSNFEIEFSGDGPVILGYNTAKMSDYPIYDGSCYTLHTIFQYCIGHTIVGVHFERTNQKMQFPIYYGIDMSDADDGIKEIRLALNGGTTLMASGSSDYFVMEHFMDFGGPVEVKYADLIKELSREAYLEYFEDWIRENENKVYEEDSWEKFSLTEVFYDELECFEYGQYGFKNLEGEIVIEPQFWCCDDFRHGLAAVAIKGPSFFADNGCKYTQEMWGYIDKTGKAVIPFRFGRAKGFNKYGVAVVQDEWNDYEDYYLIDTFGKEIPGTRCRYIDEYYDYDERFLEFSDVDPEGDNNMGLYDTKERKILVPPRTGGVIAWSDDCIKISETGKYGISDGYVHYIDESGEELYPALADKRLSWIGKPNVNGHMIVYKIHFYRAEDSVTRWHPIFGKKYESTRFYGVVDVDGNILIPLEYEEIYDRGDGGFECRFNGENKVIVLST